MYLIQNNTLHDMYVRLKDLRVIFLVSSCFSTNGRILNWTYRLFGSARRSLESTSGLHLHFGLQQQQLADLRWRTSAEFFQSFPKWIKGRHLRGFWAVHLRQHVFWSPGGRWRPYNSQNWLFYPDQFAKKAASPNWLESSASYSAISEYIPSLDNSRQSEFHLLSAQFQSLLYLSLAFLGQITAYCFQHIFMTIQPPCIAR